MKITKIEIKDFHQFKDLTIDLTYPKGHAKEGQPLDKVCFIGQSGTGKTTLLELIPKFLYNYDTQLILKSPNESIKENINIHVSYGFSNEYKNRITFSLDEATSTMDKSRSNWIWQYDGREEKNNTSEEYIPFLDHEWVNKIATKLIYFSANLNYDIEVSKENALNNKQIIDFSKEKISLVWNLILEKVQKFQEQELQIKQQISDIIIQSSGDEMYKAIEKAQEKLKSWNQIEFNPIRDIADNCLDRLLMPFKLRVKRDFIFTTKDDIGFIKIEDFSGNEIPHGLWSTGTKQVILSAMPLYLLKPKHTVILFDEPERSLYPDMQRLIVDYYSSLTENCQFFYSTHSPIIASSFEPWEIVELKFNEEGKIYREQYYQGENHVDNYKWNPKYMRWDDILQRIFDMENDGSPERKLKLDELASNNVKYKKLDKQGKGDTEEAQAILKNISLLSKQLSHWD